MSRKAMVYPYNYEFAPILRHSSLLDSVEITHLVSPKGWRLAGKDAGRADHGEDIGIDVSDDFATALEFVDTVIISDIGDMATEQTRDQISSFLLKQIEAAACSQKDIMCFYPFNAEEKKTIKTNCEKYGVQLLAGEPQIASTLEPPKATTLHRLSVPVIFVLGITENVDKFEIQMGIREWFIRNGYKPFSIGSRKNYELLGVESFPEFFLTSELDEVQKIIKFNEYVYDVQCKLNPDIVIVGIPGGVMPLSDMYPGDFGILSYMASNAVHPDYVILSTIYDDFMVQNTYFKELSDTMEKRLGYKTDAFNVSGSEVNWTKMSTFGKLGFYHHDIGKVDEVIGKLRKAEQTYGIYNLKKVSEKEDLVNTIINALSGETQVDVLNRQEFMQSKTK